MAYKSLRDFIDQLEAQSELVRVSEPVSTVLEMTEIQTRLLRNGGPAVLFEKPVMPDGSILVADWFDPRRPRSSALWRSVQNATQPVAESHVARAHHAK